MTELQEFSFLLYMVGFGAFSGFVWTLLFIWPKY